MLEAACAAPQRDPIGVRAQYRSPERIALDRQLGNAASIEILLPTLVRARSRRCPQERSVEGVGELRTHGDAIVAGTGARRVCTGNDGSSPWRGEWIYHRRDVYIDRVSKHLVDIDEEALRAARAELGTKTIKETVNRALRQAGGDHREAVKRRLDLLAQADLAAREQAWR
jgi:Arc/MetJ family transcription regulator